MKKLILLIALSVLLYSAPGYAMFRKGEGAAGKAPLEVGRSVLSAKAPPWKPASPAEAVFAAARRAAEPEREALAEIRIAAEAAGKAPLEVGRSVLSAKAPPWKPASPAEAAFAAARRAAEPEREALAEIRIAAEAAFAAARRAAEPEREALAEIRRAAEAAFAAARRAAEPEREALAEIRRAAFAAARRATEPEREALAEIRRAAREGRKRRAATEGRKRRAPTEGSKRRNVRKFAERRAEKDAKQAAELGRAAALAEGERKQQIAAAREAGPEEALAKAAVARLDQAVVQVRQAEAGWQNILEQMGKPDELMDRGVKKTETEKLAVSEERGKLLNKRNEAIAALEQVVADAATERAAWQATPEEAKVADAEERSVLRADACPCAAPAAPMSPMLRAHGAEGEAVARAAECPAAKELDQVFTEWEKTLVKQAAPKQDETDPSDDF